MIKRILILCLVLASLADFSVKAEEYDFRKVKWGMSIEDVQINELSEIVRIEDNMLIYRIEMLGEKCILQYLFENDKLIKGIYLFNIKNIHTKDRIYKNIIESLNKKYIHINDIFNEMIGIFKYGNTYITVTNAKNLGIIYCEKNIYEKEAKIRADALEKKIEGYNKDLNGL